MCKSRGEHGQVVRFQLMAISQRDSSLTPQLAEQIVAQVRRGLGERLAGSRCLQVSGRF